MQYVYRYYLTGKGNRNQRWLYVGITNNLDRRVEQHKNDSLRDISKRHDCTVQYCTVESRFDADALETILIGLYKPVFNRAKKGMDERNSPQFFADKAKNIEWQDYTPMTHRIELERALAKMGITLIDLENEIKRTEALRNSRIKATMNKYCACITTTEVTA